MKFQLKGMNPKNKTGESISYDVWAWRPLWHLIVNNAYNLDEDDRMHGQNMDELIITGAKHLCVIDSLRAILKNRSHGEIQRAVYQSPYIVDKGQKKIVAEATDASSHAYSVDWDEVIDLFRFCKSNEGFAISQV